MALYGSIDDVDVKAISKSISDTAVDVFIYDTRKDSDGGAWRKRTQHTSWYNETLNTATRGARKEFPAVAVIVAESTQVTIYDGDDPDMPMWMVFDNSNSDGSQLVSTGNSRVWSSVAMLNGRLAVGMDYGTTTGMGVDQVDFILDKGWRIRQGGGSAYKGTFKGSIAERRNTTYDGIVVGNIPNETVNDLAMTVLPNAPIDAATGLPVPTIAVATEGSVSVIKDDGTVVDITSSSTYDRSIAVDFLADNRLSLEQHNNSSGSIAWLLTIDVPTGDRVITTNTKVSGEGYYDTRYPLSFNQDFWINQNASSSGDAIQEVVGLPNSELVAHTGILGITKIAEEGSKVNPLGAYITSSYNTGWMNGDIKLATLSDTDATNVTGSAKFTNDLYTNFTASGGGGFTVNGNGTVTVGNGDGVTDAILTSPSFDLVIGKRYIVDIQTSGTSGTGIGFYLNGAGGPNGYLWDRQFEFVATQVQNTFFLYRYLGHNGSATLTKAVVREAEADRSVNGNGLQVFGTVTKSAVATGADMVGYSGFATNNYLKQPYNSDLDFGTGDFSVMLWFNTPNKSVAGTLLHRGSNEIGDGSWATNAVTQIEFNTSNLYALVGTNNFAINSGPNVPLTSISNNTWHHYVMVRRGGRIYAYLDGNYMDDAANILTNTNSTAKLYIGERPVASRVFNGSLALYRISATAPSVDQIKKIYNDEKHLFQENAKATLYGSSDAVTALAYDDDTELLHVGTSAGRSVFQGLRRIDNTTDAVGAAISASNGMVAED